MKKDNLKRAIGIEAEISSLQTQVNNLNKAISEYRQRKEAGINQKNLNDNFYIGVNAINVSTVYLKSMPIEFDIFISLCVPTIENNIKKLETELETL